MPRNGSGVYSLPAGSLVSNGDTSDATDINTPIQDIEADMNTARPIVAGGTGATNAADALVNLGLTATAAELNTLDGITATTAELNILDGITATTAEINYLDGKTLSGSDSQIMTGTAGSDGAIPSWNADGDLVQEVGSFSQGDILYHDGTSLSKRPLGTARQVLEVNQIETAPRWAPAPFVALSSDSVTSGDSDIQIELPSGYDAFRLYLRFIVPATDAVDLHMRVSNDGGSTWESGASAYAYQNLIVRVGSGVYASQGASEIVLASATTVGSDTGEYGVTLTLDIHGAVSSSLPTAMHGFVTTWRSDGQIESGYIGAQYLTAETIDRLQIFASSGNLESGSWALEGKQDA